MITRIKKRDAADVTLADIEHYLVATGKINILYADRSILEIRQCAGNSDKDGAGYTVVYKDYEPLGCCDDWSCVETEHFDVSRRGEAIARFLARLHDGPGT